MFTGTAESAFAVVGGIQCRVDLLDVLEHLLIERQAIRAMGA